MILLLWILQVAFLGSFYRSITIARLRTYAHTISDTIASDGDAELAIYDASEDCGVCMTLYRIEGSRGSTLVSSHVKNNCFIHTFLTTDEISRIYSGTLSSGGKLVTNLIGDTENTDGGESMVYSVLINGTEGEKYLLLFNTESYPVDATASMIRTQLSLITLLMLICAAMLAFLISKRITRPVAQLSAEAQRLATGDYDVHFSVSGIKEIEKLGETLGYAASELSKHERTQTERIANISHDLRTPLTLISGYSEVMRDIPEERTAENMQVVIDESARLTELVSDILDATRLDSDSELLGLSTFCLSDDVSDECLRYSHMLNAKGYTVTYELIGERAFVSADEKRIMRAFCNLVNNALSFTGEDKLVQIKQIVANGVCRTEVIDTGIGIGEDDLGMIWERYYRARDRKAKGVPGTGLGLSIFRKIMEQHGARYGVISTPGSGSTFWFELPTV